MKEIISTPRLIVANVQFLFFNLHFFGIVLYVGSFLDTYTITDI